MRRHEIDPISLVTGLVFVAIAVAYLVGQYTHTDISAGWVLPLGLIGLGLAGLTGSVRRGLRGSRPDAQPWPEPGADAAPTPTQPVEPGTEDTPLS